jgi:hypothetical protein
MKESIERRAISWLLSGDTGLSSEEILSAALSIKIKSSWGNFCRYPLDPSDFGRCSRLLKAIPEFRKIAFPKLARRSKVWKLMIKKWDDMEKIYQEEYPSSKAPKLYELMKKIEETAQSK